MTEPFDIVATPAQAAEHGEAYAAAVAALQAADPGARSVVVRIRDGEALDLYLHDIEGALRSFRYLAQKAEAGYSPDDARGRKVMDSIRRHLATVESLKASLVDGLLAAKG